MFFAGDQEGLTEKRLKRSVFSCTPRIKGVPHVDMISRLHMQVIRSREAERKRLARDLHDWIIQTLIEIKMKIHGMASRSGDFREEDLSARHEEIQQVIEDLRKICTELRPANLDIFGLASAIQSRVAEIEQDASFQILFLFEGNEEQEICEESQFCIYRFVQESLTNVQKHAQAKTVQVWLSITSETVSAKVVDDGNGFSVPSNLNYLTDERHFGLVGLKEQVEAAKGTLRVNSKPGEGCAITAQVPVG